MKQIFNSLTKKEIESVASNNISPKLKAIFKQEGISAKDAVSLAQEFLMSNDFVQEQPYFVPESNAPSETTKEHEEHPEEENPEEEHPEELLETIEKVLSQQQTTSKKKNAAERLAMLQTLDMLHKKHVTTSELLDKISLMIKEQEENEGITISIYSLKERGINITKTFAVNQCLLFIQEETKKKLLAIENEIENLEF